jgi:CheY-like chemotaxis protein
MLMFTERSLGFMIEDKCLDSLSLGGMLGDSVARNIKEFNETKIILNSAYNVDDVLKRDLENGNYISRYIQKPFDTDRLTDRMAEIVKN